MKSNKTKKTVVRMLKNREGITKKDFIQRVEQKQNGQRTNTENEN